MRKCVINIGLIISMLFLSGCWGHREVEEMAWVMAVGIDQGSTPDSYLITYQVVLPKSGEGGGASSDSWTVSVEGKSVRDTAERVYNMLYKQPFLGTMEEIIIGDKVAKQGINDVVDFFQRYYRMRRTMHIMVTKGEAKDVLNTEPRFNQSASLTLMHIFDHNEKTSVYPPTRLERYLTLIHRDNSAQLLPVVNIIEPDDQQIQYEEKEKSKELEVRGAGVLRRDRLVDYLSDEETKGAMWLDDEVNERIITAVDEESGITLGGTVVSTKTDFSVSKEEGEECLHFNIKAHVVLNAVEGEWAMDQREWQEFLNEGEKKLANVIEGECQKAIQKAKDIKVDFIRAGRFVERKNPKYWSTVKDDWENILPDFPITVKADVTITHNGTARNGPVNWSE